MRTLPDYLAPGLDVVSIGLNPSLNSVRAGFYFATPRNRFWRALNASRLIDREIDPGTAGIELLFHEWHIGFTDVVKRPTRGAAELRVRDFRRWAPVLAEKLLRYQPRIAWFHGKVAWNRFRYEYAKLRGGSDWGRQPLTLGRTLCFVTPNPSPANAVFSLTELVGWYDSLAALRDSNDRGGREMDSASAHYLCPDPS